MAGEQAVKKASDYSWLKLLCMFIGIGSLVFAGGYVANRGYAIVPVAVICTVATILALIKTLFGGEWKVYIAFMNAMAIGLGGLIIAAAGLGILASPILIYFSI